MGETTLTGAEGAFRGVVENLLTFLPLVVEALGFGPVCWGTNPSYSTFNWGICANYLLSEP